MFTFSSSKFKVKHKNQLMKKYRLKLYHFNIYNITMPNNKVLTILSP